jgi:hypothetical protein
LKSLLRPAFVRARSDHASLEGDFFENNGPIGGTLVGESADSVTIRTPDPEDTSKQIEREIPLAEIAVRQPPMSAMPPMSALLSKREIRDLVTFLTGLGR